MNRYRMFFKLLLVMACLLILAVVMTGSASAEKDFYGVYFHPFTLGTILNGCPSRYDDDIGKTVYNCDPINVIFPGRTWEEARDLLPSEEGWTTVGSGSTQQLHFDGMNTYAEDGRLFKPDDSDTRYHIRFWQAPSGGPLVTFASVHHESGSLFHTIDMDWEGAEAEVAVALCGLACGHTDPLTEQIGIQGLDEEWRGWFNNGSATVIPAPGPPDDPPVAGFSFTCNGLSCDFDASASYDPDGGDIIAYAWDFDDGNNASGVNAGHVYASAGTYAVTLTVTDDEGSTGTDNQDVTVVGTPATPVHVGDLEGASSVKKNWSARVTITVHDAAEELVPNATVSGVWSDGALGTGSCKTDGSGACAVTYAELSKKKVPSIIFTVTNIDHASLSYVAAGNHDPQGNSSGTAIQVNKDGTTQDPGTGQAGELTLTAVGYKVRGVHHVDLAWNGATSPQVDIYRDDDLIATWPSGTIPYTDITNQKGGASYLYQVCEAGATDVCSEVVAVTF